MLPIILNIADFSLPLKSPILIFSTILFIILFAPILLNKVRIPHLIGLIIAGALIGPKGFYLMERDDSFKLFGQVGLLYIMFLAGLEIDLAEFKKKQPKKHSFWYVHFSFTNYTRHPFGFVYTQFFVAIIGIAGQYFCLSYAYSLPAYQQIGG